MKTNKRYTKCRSKNDAPMTSIVAILKKKLNKTKHDVK